MAASSAGSLRWVIGLPIFIAFTCCLILNAASQLLENTNPSLAATLNPLNTDARINVLVEELNAGTGELEDMATQARALVAISPVDARVYSLSGVVEQRRGDGGADAASGWFEKALQHSKSERFALTWQLQRALSGGDSDAAVHYYDLLMRRWPQLQDELGRVADGFIASPSSAQALAKSLQLDPPWRSEVVLHLIKQPAGALFASSVLMESLPSPGRMTEIAETIAALIKYNLGSQAYALFVETLAANEAPLAGYVYDSQFQSRPGRRPFEWRVVPDSTVDMAYPDGEQQRGLRLRFLDSPTKLANIAQNMLLVPGGYTVEVVGSTHGLVIPKGLYWTARCAATGQQLFRLDIPAGTNNALRVSADFVVPYDCEVQFLTIQSDAKPNNWRDRYRGDVLFEQISIHRRDS